MLDHHKKKFAINHKEEDGKIFAKIALLSCTAESAFLTIFPLILNEKLNNESLVGLYFAIIGIVVFFVSIFSAYLFKRFSRVYITRITLIVCAFMLSVLTFAAQIWQIAFLDLFRGACFTVFWISISLFVSDYTKIKNLGQTEGRFFLFSNIGWVIGPLLAGFLARIYGNESVFILSGAILLIVLILFLQQHFIIKNPYFGHKKSTYELKELFNNIKEYFKNINLFRVFLISFGLSSWWAISTVYIPLEINRLGFGQDIIGWIIAGGFIPLVLLEETIGRLSDKKGLGKFIASGFFIIAIFCVFFIPLYRIPIILLITFALVNIGSAFIEPLQDAYYFKSVKQEDKERLYGIYHTAVPMADIIASMFAALLFTIGGQFFLWLGTAILMTIFGLTALTIKK